MSTGFCTNELLFDCQENTKKPERRRRWQVSFCVFVGHAMFAAISRSSCAGKLQSTPLHVISVTFEAKLPRDCNLTAADILAIRSQSCTAAGADARIPHSALMKYKVVQQSIKGPIRPLRQVFGCGGWTAVEGDKGAVTPCWETCFKHFAPFGVESGSINLHDGE